MPVQSTFEREKWAAELELRQRELSIREREQANRDAELLLKKHEQRVSAWRNPLTVAILAAAIAAGGNALVAWVNGTHQRAIDERRRIAEVNLERSKAESTRILEMIKTGDPEHAAANLSFLLKSGLIADRTLAQKITQFLQTRKPGSGPSLPSPGGGQIEFEKTELLTEKMQGELERTLSAYFEYLDRIGFPRPTERVSVAVEDMKGDLNAYYTENRIIIDTRLVDDASIALHEYTHHVLIDDDVDLDTHELHYASIEGGLADYFTCSFLDNPHLGERSARLFDPGAKYLRTLENQGEFSKLGTSVMEPIEGGEIWGGLFWDIRSRVGASTADTLLSQAWLSFDVPARDADVAVAFLKAVESEAQRRGADVVKAVRESAAARGFPIRN